MSNLTAKQQIEKAIEQEKLIYLDMGKHYPDPELLEALQAGLAACEKAERYEELLKLAEGMANDLGPFTIGGYEVESFEAFRAWQRRMK